MTDQMKYGDTQRIKTTKVDWGYQYKDADGNVYDIMTDTDGGGYWYAEDEFGTCVAEGQTKKECVISLQSYLEI